MFAAANRIDSRDTKRTSNEIGDFLPVILTVEIIGQTVTEIVKILTVQFLFHMAPEPFGQVLDSDCKEDMCSR